MTCIPTFHVCQLSNHWVVQLSLPLSTSNLVHIRGKEEKKLVIMRGLSFHDTHPLTRKKTSSVARCSCTIISRACILTASLFMPGCTC